MIPTSQVSHVVVVVGGAGLEGRVGHLGAIAQPQAQVAITCNEGEHKALLLAGQFAYRAKKRETVLLAFLTVHIVMVV